MGRLRDWLERHLAAAALAEEGLHDEALALCGARPAPRNESLDALLAAHGVRMLCGAAPAAALRPRAAEGGR
jgi:hypothetical protein